MDVTVITSSNCPSCETLKKQLTLKDVDFNTVGMLSREGMSLVKEHGFRSVPQLIVGGSVVVPSEFLESCV